MHEDTKYTWNQGKKSLFLARTQPHNDVNSSLIKILTHKPISRNASFFSGFERDSSFHGVSKYVRVSGRTLNKISEGFWPYQVFITRCMKPL